SPQECVVPFLTVRTAAPVGPAAVIAEIRWIGLRCRVQVTGRCEGLTLDLRTRPASAATSLAAAPKPLATDGQASLVVPDDSRLGDAAVVVLMDAGGQVVAQAPTIVGE